MHINNYFKCKWIKYSNQKTHSGWMDPKTRPIYMLSTRNPLQTSSNTYWLKVRGSKSIFHANGKQKKTGVTILISDKIDLKIKITRDKEGWSEIAQSCPTLCDPMDCSPPGSSVHGILPGKNTGVGCHFLLQGIFPTQGSNPSLPHCRQML